MTSAAASAASTSAATRTWGARKRGRSPEAWAARRTGNDVMLEGLCGETTIASWASAVERMPSSCRMASAVARTRSDCAPPTSVSRIGGWATRAPATKPDICSASGRRGLRPKRVDRVAIPACRRARGIRVVRAGGREQDATRDRDDGPASIRPERRLERGREVGTLRADTRDEEQPVARDLAHVAQLGRRRRADNEGDVVVMIPADAGARDVPVEGLAIAAHMLEFRRSRVRCSADDEDFLVPVREKGRDGVIAQPGVDGDGIGAPGLEHR